MVDIVAPGRDELYYLTEDGKLYYYVTGQPITLYHQFTPAPQSIDVLIRGRSPF